MRKAKKCEAESFLKLLAEAHDQIKKSIESKQIPAALDLLEQCQSGAIELGTMIEQEEGEGMATVSFLERYCELTYQIHEKLRDEPAADAVRIGRDLKKSLIQIENSLKKDIKVSRVAVFLPYKASMWDSLESVWRAAREDADCDTYVIPIPYYDKNPDGSFREMHDETDLFPADVPITRYDAFDFEQMRPDLIFIHNPYDNNNYVTSVHPFFYSDHLKQYTDCLVYVPYYILDEIRPDNQAEIESIKHFITTPAVIHADRVIVQSEDMRKIYISVLMEMTGADAASRKYWEQKILGLGSPKVDKVLHTKKEDLEIPGQWNSIIRKPDGSRKKIIFYNTSIAALLEHNEQMLAKMQDVFQVFWENRDEVALLWRPHPLIESTLTSMRPMLWEQYRKMRDQYIADGWGIYDDSADMNRAVALSDAYYGDGSSVLVLYRHLHKRNMMQNVSVRSRGVHSADDLWAYNFVVDGACIWFVSYWHNRLYQYNLDSQKIEFSRKLPVANDMEGLFYNIIKVGTSLVLAPSSADEICIYRIEEDTFQKIALRDSYSGVDKFGICAVCGTTVFLFPFRYPAICKIDVSNNEVCYCTDWYGTYSFDNRHTIFLRSYYQRDHVIYLLVAKTNRVFRYDMRSGQSEMLAIGSMDARYTTINGVDTGILYLSDRQGDITVYDETTKDTFVLEHGLSDKAAGRQSAAFAGSVVCGEKIIYFPESDDTCVQLDTRSNKICRMENDLDLMRKTIQDDAGCARIFSQIEQTGDHVLGFDIAERCFFQYDVFGQGVRRIQISDILPDDIKKELFMQFVTSKKRFPTEASVSYFNLNMLIEMVKDQQEDGHVTEERTAAEKIYASV